MTFSVDRNEKNIIFVRNSEKNSVKDTIIKRILDKTAQSQDCA